MKIAIDLIKVDDELRIRKDLGNLDPLLESISKVGLINPIVIDEENNLIAGYRRLQACKKLGMKEIDIKIIEVKGDSLKILDVEVAENFFRKDFTPEEILASEKRRQDIIEASREKGFFERVQHWFKKMFGPSPAPMKNEASMRHPASDDQPSDQNNEKEQAQKETMTFPETSEPLENPGEPRESFPRPDTHQGERTIKWRTS